MAKTTFFKLNTHLSFFLYTNTLYPDPAPLPALNPALCSKSSNTADKGKNPETSALARWAQKTI
jgi:hypothetical protein